MFVSTDFFSSLGSINNGTSDASMIHHHYTLYGLGRPGPRARGGVAPRTAGRNERPRPRLRPAHGPRHPTAVRPARRREGRAHSSPCPRQARPFKALAPDDNLLANRPGIMQTHLGKGTGPHGIHAVLACSPLDELSWATGFVFSRRASLLGVQHMTLVVCRCREIPWLHRTAC
jgi:hypothetical protein